MPKQVTEEKRLSTVGRYINNIRDKRASARREADLAATVARNKEHLSRSGYSKAKGDNWSEVTKDAEKRAKKLPLVAKDLLSKKEITRESAQLVGSRTFPKGIEPTGSGRAFKVSDPDMKPIRGTGLIGIAAQAPSMVGKALDLRKAMKAKGKKPTLGEGMRILLGLPQEKPKKEVLKGQKPPKEV